MNKKKISVIICVVVAILGLSSIGVLKAKEDSNVEVVVIQPKQETIASEVLIPGTLELLDEQVVYHSIKNGEEFEILVEEGQDVEVGTELVQYTNSQMDLEKEQMALSVESANLRINHIKKQQEALRKKKNDLEKEVGKDEARKMVEAEEQQVDMELKMANIELRQIQLQRQGMTHQEEKLIVKSEIEGSVIQVNEFSGNDLNETNSPILHLANKGNLVVRGALSEYDSLLVNEGQEVHIRSDAILDEEWKGLVDTVAYFPKTVEGLDLNATAVQYPISVVLTEGNTASLRPGLQLILQIVIEEKEALTIPLSSIWQEDGQSYVFIENDGFVEKKEVELGIVSGENIEVISGMGREDRVIKEPTSRLYDGMEVSIHD
ncbi:efflux RND transporter periplasmic adaptor subunit [Alkalihalobacterium sp. APHAB7]|uniref:efflux RND transporter periplasmic adaptor subunit n=1 Tax=Alkalihalobacterium sp. APHAB7 TaxID=3402081 RepID=UPI003AADFFAD